MRNVFRVFRRRHGAVVTRPLGTRKGQDVGLPGAGMWQTFPGPRHEEATSGPSSRCKVRTGHCARRQDGRPGGGPTVHVRAVRSTVGQPNGFGQAHGQ